MEADWDNLSCLVKLRHPWEDSETKVLSAVNKIKGVRTAEIDDSGNLHVYGDADVDAVMRELKKVAGSPELVYHNGGGSKDADNWKPRIGFLKSLFKKNKPKSKTIVLGAGAGRKSLWRVDRQYTCSGSRSVELDYSTVMYLPML